MSAIIQSFTGPRSAVLELLRRCNEADGIDIPIFLESEEQQPEKATSFGCTVGGELIGFAHLPDDPQPEACLMVHPDHRRRGIGRALLQAIRDEARHRGLTSVLIVNDRASARGTAFLAAAGARHVDAEHRLSLDRGRIVRPERNPALRLRPAGPDEIETLAAIQAAAFEHDVDEGRYLVQRGFAEGNRSYYLGVLDGEPIGLLRTGVWDDGADITAFGVVPRHRGRGYGRQMLLDAVDNLFHEGWSSVTIEVATDNDHALGLYRSCGFEVIATFDYYDMTP
ncbi:MAG: GNAT family N-acetyltransferase [Thermomicrobiales bacterium]|nr:GNAT family N-acetyltransferase [Thermomicrobiales bacterium]